ncbi:MAG: methyltransferase [Bacilli bacterium]|nr:methyltransferase [Bacilli bacterium]
MLANNEEVKRLKEEVRELLQFEEEYIDWLRLTSDCSNTETYEIYEKRKQLSSLKLSRINKDYLSKFLNTHIIEVSRREVFSNSYLENIKCPKASKNGLMICSDRIIPNDSVSVYEESPRDYKTFRQKRRYFYCKDTLLLPILTDLNTLNTWMTVEPFEINSFEKFIKRASGNVLLLGCGLGYVAYMLSQKSNVNSVMIIDNNQDIIDLFNERLLPQFPNKDKVSIVNTDGLAFLENADLSKFDYINLDIWRDIPDMLLPYFNGLEIEKKNPSVRFSYWFEERLKEEVQNGILKRVAGSSSDSLEGLSIPERIGAYLVDTTPINNRNDLQELMKLDNFRSLMLDWYQDNKDDVLSYVQKEEEFQKSIKKTLVTF